MRMNFFLLKIVACKNLAIQVLCMLIWNNKKKKKTEGDNGYLLMFCCRFNDSSFALSLALYLISSQNTFSHGHQRRIGASLRSQNLY